MGIKTPTQSGRLTIMIKVYKGAIVASALALPAGAMAYLSAFADAGVSFHSEGFHEVAIAGATLMTLFLAFLSHRVHVRREDSFFRFLTLGLLGFAAVYAPHGVLTRNAQHNAMLFLAYGPVSRLTLSAYLMIAFFRSTSSAADRGTDKRLHWRRHVALFAIIVVVAFILAGLSAGLTPVHLRITESAALALFGLSIVLALVTRRRTPLRWFYPGALALFAQGSIAFLLARPWNHMWWLAHFVFGAGSLVLGYGIARVYEDKS